MKTLNEATQTICDLKGSILALECALNALLLTMAGPNRQAAQSQMQVEVEACSTALLGALVSEHTRAAFERDSQRLWSSLQGPPIATA